jgi:predicted ATPase
MADDKVCVFIGKRGTGKSTLVTDILWNKRNIPAGIAMSGTEEGNVTLSHDRAKAVNDYLISKGIAHERLTYQGYGSSKPVNNNVTEADKAQNRRTELNLRNY